MKLNIEMVRDALTDPSTYHLASESFEHAIAKRLAEEYKCPPEVAASFANIGKGELDSNYAAVNKAVESPIERMLFTSLANHFAYNNPFRLYYRLVGTDQDASELIKHKCELYETYEQWCQMFDSIPEDLRPKSFREFVEYVRYTSRPTPDQSWVEDIDLYYIFGRRIQQRHALFVILQAPLPSVKVDGRSIRADALCFVPTNPNMRLVIECDGFEHHGRKDMFVSDRKRDRALMQAGYTVRRYSGSEIWGNPVRTSNDLYEYLTDQFMPKARKVRPKKLPDASEFIDYLRQRSKEGRPVFV